MHFSFGNEIRRWYALVEFIMDKYAISKLYICSGIYICKYGCVKGIYAKQKRIKPVRIKTLASSLTYISAAVGATKEVLAQWCRRRSEPPRVGTGDPVTAAELRWTVFAIAEWRWSGTPGGGWRRRWWRPRMLWFIPPRGSVRIAGRQRHRCGGAGLEVPRLRFIPLLIHQFPCCPLCFPSTLGFAFWELSFAWSGGSYSGLWSCIANACYWFVGLIKLLYGLNLLFFPSVLFIWRDLISFSFSLNGFFLCFWWLIGSVS